jgi:hypothetical protein
MNYRTSIVVALACSLGFAGCGPSPTQSIAFKAPAGWTSTPSMFGAQVWLKGDLKSSTQMIILVKATEKPGADKKLAMTSSLSDMNYKGAKVKKAAEITICGDQKAQYLEASGQNKSGEPSAVEVITTAYGDQRYFVIYSRPEASQPDAAAETAIHSICKK